MFFFSLDVNICVTLQLKQMQEAGSKCSSVFFMK